MGPPGKCLRREGEGSDAERPGNPIDRGNNVLMYLRRSTEGMRGERRCTFLVGRTVMAVGEHCRPFGPMGGHGSPSPAHTAP